MRYYGTRDKSAAVSFARAALEGLAPDGGLYVPETIPRYSSAVRNSLSTMSIPEIALETIRPFVAGEIPTAVLEELIEEAFNFPAPLVAVGDRRVMELFHGPTAAFKDFGARFMARAFSYLRRNESKSLRILVATSGDTGGAVADGFYNVPGIDVTVLYPKGRVSPLQERQIAGLGGNVSACAVEGSFDDCQAMVKAVFSKPEVRSRHLLSSANSINIARLIPQAVYYAVAAGRAWAGKTDPEGPATARLRAGQSGDGKTAGRVLICVPSGNFGNLTAGLYARKMGAPIAQFIAATNINKTVPDYLISGDYKARDSQASISNAMDVGAPSNFERMQSLYSHARMAALIRGVWVDDKDTRETIERVAETHGYLLDPHTAVGWRGMDMLEAESGPLGDASVLISTAHPSKFAEVVEPICGEIPLAPALRQAMDRKVESVSLPPKADALIDYLDNISL